MPTITGTKTEHTRVCWSCGRRRRLRMFVQGGERGICKECHRDRTAESRARGKRLRKKSRKTKRKR